MQPIPARRAALTALRSVLPDEVSRRTEWTFRARRA
jgi:hypothetical protein